MESNLPLEKCCLISNYKLYLMDESWLEIRNLQNNVVFTLDVSDTKLWVKNYLLISKIWDALVANSHYYNPDQVDYPFRKTIVSRKQYDVRCYLEILKNKVSLVTKKRWLHDCEIFTVTENCKLILDVFVKMNFKTE